MPFATYSDLQSQVNTRLARDDLTAEIPDYILLFEAVAARRLQVRLMEVTAAIVTTGGTGPLPADFLRMRRVSYTGDPAMELEYAHPTYLRLTYPTTPAGTPRVYTIEGGNVVIRPVDDAGLSIQYFNKPTALVSALNWLYTAHFDCYLAGTLTEAFARTRNAELTAFWQAKRDAILDEIEKLDFGYRANMAMRVAGPTP